MDSTELRDHLASLLPDWDGVVVEGVTAAITQASNRAEIDGILKDYIPASEAQARKVVGNYAAAKFPIKSNEAATAQLPTVSAEDLKASVFMGVNVKTTVKKRNNQNKVASGDAAPVLAKKVVNCLKCGKIFDCRQPNGDAMRFLASGGCCTYCGNRVRLTYTDGSTNDDMLFTTNSDLTSSEGLENSKLTALKNTAGAEPSSLILEQAREAEALRDRLVEFDRQGAKRTTVIDDQSDYFAIDSNAWLSDEERAELKRRQAEAEAAAEASKKRMTVTVDLLGRRVVMDNQDASLLSLEESNTSAAAAIEAAMAATAAEKPQGGGSAATAYINNSNNLDSTGVSRMVPSGGTSKYIFIESGGKGGAAKKNKQQQGSKDKTRAGVERLQHDGT